MSSFANGSEMACTPPPHINLCLYLQTYTHKGFQFYILRKERIKERKKNILVYFDDFLFVLFYKVDTIILFSVVSHIVTIWETTENINVTILSTVEPLKG